MGPDANALASPRLRHGFCTELASASRPIPRTFGTSEPVSVHIVSAFKKRVRSPFASDFNPDSDSTHLCTLQLGEGARHRTPQKQFPRRSSRSAHISYLLFPKPGTVAFPTYLYGDGLEPDARCKPNDIPQRPYGRLMSRCKMTRGRKLSGEPATSFDNSSQICGPCIVIELGTQVLGKWQLRADASESRSGCTRLSSSAWGAPSR